jgi:hypothetical protein
LHRNCISAIERAESLAGTLRTTLSEMLAELVLYLFRV